MQPRKFGERSIMVIIEPLIFQTHVVHSKITKRGKDSVSRHLPPSSLWNRPLFNKPVVYPRKKNKSQESGIFPWEQRNFLPWQRLRKTPPCLRKEPRADTVGWSKEKRLAFGSVLNCFSCAIPRHQESPGLRNWRRYVRLNCTLMPILDHTGPTKMATS